MLIDRHDYHTFQPLLYQLATGLLETSAVGHSLRDLMHGQDTRPCTREVTGIDLAARRAEFEELSRYVRLLVLALGAEAFRQRGVSTRSVYSVCAVRSGRPRRGSHRPRRAGRTAVRGRGGGPTGARPPARSPSEGIRRD